MASYQQDPPDIGRSRDTSGTAVLVRALESSEGERRQDAMRTLVRMGMPALPGLLRAFADAGKKDLMDAAGEVLAQWGEPALPALDGLIRDDDERTRSAAASALGYLGAPAAPLLVAALHDPSLDVKVRAARSLARIRWTFPPDQIQEKVIWHVALGDTEDLVRIKKAAYPHLVELLDDPDYRIRVGAIKGLGNIRSVKALPLLLTLLKSEELEVRSAIVESLGKIKNPKAIPFLVYALKDVSPYVRVEAVLSLEKLGWTPQNQQETVRFLIAKEQWSNLALIEPGALPSLVQALLDENAYTRNNVTAILLKRGTEAVPALQQAVAGSEPLKSAAAGVLDRIAKDAPPPGTAGARSGAGDVSWLLTDATIPGDQNLTPAWDEIDEEPEEEGPESPRARVQRLSALLSDPDPAIRVVTIEQLRATGQPAVRPLIGALKDPDKDVRSAAAEALGSLKSVQAVRFLIHVLLNDPATGARIASARSLGAIGDAYAIPYLAGVFSDPELEVRAAAAYALGHIGGRAKEIVVSRTRHADPRVRAAACLSLGTMPDTAVIRYIVAGLADTDPGVRDHAARALDTVAHASPRIFLEAIPGLLIAGSVAERGGILDTLSTVENDQVIWIAYAVREDPDPAIQEKARNLIRQRQPSLLPAQKQDTLRPEDETALRALVGQLSAPDPAIRTAAATRIRQSGRLAMPALFSGLRTNASAVPCIREIIASMPESIVDDLIGAIHDESIVVREVAITGLGRSSLERAVHAIGWVLYGEKEPELRRIAAVALGKPANTGGITPLVHCLSDAPEVSRAAIESLGTIGGDVARDALIRSLEGADGEQVACTARALERCGSDARIALTTALMQGSPRSRLNVARVLDLLSWQPEDLPGQIQYLVAKEDWEPLSALGLPALEYLIASFEVDAPKSRAEIARIIGHLGEPARLPLIQAISDNRAAVREGAVLALGFLGGTETAILPVLKDPSATVRYAAALSLDRIAWVPGDDGAAAAYEVAKKEWAAVAARKKHAAPALVRVLGDQDFDVKSGAIHALGILGDQRTVPVLIRLAEKSGDTRIVLSVTAALGRMSGPDVLRFLTGALTHTVFAVRASAATALEKSGWTPEDTAGKVRFLIALQKPKLIAEMGQAAFPAIIEALVDDQVLGRLVITEALISMGEPAIAGLTGILRGDDTRLYYEARNILDLLQQRENDQPGQPGGDRYRPAISTRSPDETKRLLTQTRESLSGADENARMNAVSSFEELGHTAAGDLISLAGDDNPLVKTAAFAALGRMRSPAALPALLPLLEDSSPETRKNVVEVLGTIRDTRVLPSLVRCFRDPSAAVRTRAIAALAGMGNLAVHTVLEAADDDRPEVRTAAFETLGKLPDPVVLHPLVKGLADPDVQVRLAAAKVLGSLIKRPDSPVMDILNRILSEGEPVARLSSLDALAVTDDLRALDLLSLAVQDDDEQIRNRATVILSRKEAGTRGTGAGENGGSPGETECSRFIQLLSDPELEICGRAQAELRLRGRPAAKPLLDALTGADPGVQALMVSLLEEMGSAILDDLAGALEKAAPPVRPYAAALLGKLADSRSVSVLGHALYTEPDAGTRQVIADALGHLGDPRAVKSLVDILGDPSTGVSLAAIRSLGQLRDERAIRPLIQQLNNDDEEIVCAAADALIRIGEPARAELVSLLCEGDHPRKAIAAGILEALHCIPRDPVEYAHFLIGKEEWYAFEAAGPAAIGPLAGLLGDHLLHIRIGAVVALSKIGGTGAIRPLITALNDPSPIVWQRAKNSLVCIGMPVLEPLEGALAQGEIRFPSVAEDILHRIRQSPVVPPDGEPVPVPQESREDTPPS
jgi:HEAT repeat protein